MSFDWIRSLFAIGLVLAALSGRAESHAGLPPDAEYVSVDARGHLIRHGERVRFWGVVGKFPGVHYAGKDIDPYRVNEATVERLKFLGFNMVRFWEAPDPDQPYEKGDRSRNDVIDHFIATCYENGILIWWAGFGGAVGRALPADAGVIDDPESAAAWADAVGGDGWPLGKKSFISSWDPRAKALRVRNLTRLADHVNRHTGRRYADEPAIAVWELVNEDWWLFNMQRGGFLRSPPFFIEQLRDQWNGFLDRKYANDATLKAAWGNNLLEGESLAERSVALLPLPRRNVDDQQAVSLGVAVESAVASAIDQAMFNERRGSDVLEFLVEMILEQKRAERDALKPLGRSLSLSPMIFDTGVGGDLPTQMVHAAADAVSHATYINGTMHPDPSHRRFPWYSALEEHPRLCWDKPWLENTRQPGKPFLVYENNIMQPAKYRAEHPIRMATLGMINDWDAVVFHYWGMPRDPRLPEPFTAPIDQATPHHPTQGYHFQFDPVLQAATTAAGGMFTRFVAEPVAEPTTFVFGRRSIFAPAMVDYGPFSERFMPTAWRYGARLMLDPTREDDAILGSSRRRGVYEPSPIRPTEQITIDPQGGFIRIDTPGAVSFCGFLGEDTAIDFEHGVRFDHVSVVNDPGMAYPVAADEKYLAVVLWSRDGLALTESKELSLFATSTAFNDGFEIDESKVTAEWFWPRGAIRALGELPVRHARVAGTLQSEALRGRTYTVLDWHGRVVRTGSVDGGAFTLDPVDRAYEVRFSRVP